MSLKIADNFSYFGKKPLDSRLVFGTLSAMAGFSESSLYDGLIAYNQESEKTYIYKASNESDAVLGKWRTIADEVADADTRVKEYQKDTYYTADTLIYLNDILGRVTANYTSNTAYTDLEQCFNLDVNNGYIIKVTQDIPAVPEFLGSVATEDAEDMPEDPSKGNWVLVQDCINTAPGQPGIGVFNGEVWNITPIPSGTFTFPEPLADGKKYFRTRDFGETDGYWVAFSVVDGDETPIRIKAVNSEEDAYIPGPHEPVWDTSRDCLVLGNGTTNVNGLDPFYQYTLTQSEIVGTLGYAPENTLNKGTPNGYAPLDSNGIVPVGNLPANLTDTYSKSEIDAKDAQVTGVLTLALNNEGARAQGIEEGLRADLDAHTEDTSLHVTQSEKDAWDAKVDADALTDFTNHISDDGIHVTQLDKDKWDGMTTAHFVLSEADLPTENNSIGNLGYVQRTTSADGKIICDDYIWDGTEWKQLDSGGVSLTFNWNNLEGRPAATPLVIDNAVTIAHSHTNKTVLDKIGQSAAGNFTFDGIEIGVKVVFCNTELLLPAIGEVDTLYVVYEDSRTRQYPSISVYRDGAYQILGRGAQDNAPVVGDMQILQADYYGVQANSKYKIHFDVPNQYFAFLPVEILKEIAGLTNQTRVLCDVDSPAKFSYNEQLLTIDETAKCKIDIKPYPTILDTISNFFYSHVDVDLTYLKDIDSVS